MEQVSTFGGQLRLYREAAGLSQEDLAERAGLTASAISALERGARQRPFPHTVQLLATALGLDEASRAALIAAVPKRGTGEADRSSLAASIPAADALNVDQPSPTPSGRQVATAIQSAPSSIARSVTAFVGRQGELLALRARLDAAFAGQGSIVMLVGEAGIGKTRLAREFADDAAGQGAVVLWGCSFEGDWQPPYGPWVEALGAYARTKDPEHLGRVVGAGAAPIARLLPELSAALPDLPIPSPLSPDEERFRLYDAIIRFFLSVALEQPVVLILDDLHWADADSLRLLRHLGRFVGRARILVVGAYRDPEFGLNEQHPLIGTLSVLRREAEYERIALRGFTRDEVAEYLAQTAGQPLPQALAMRIGDETSGNPFYAREVFRHLTEEAKVLQRGGRWSTDISIRELGIPEGVRQVVGRRVTRLSERTGTLLRLAAGFTGTFGFDVLQALSELPEQALLDCLDESLQAGLIRSSGQVPPRYEFAHAIVRHTLYEGLNLDRRTRLHRRIALALEQVRTGAAEEAAELAAQYHASAALPGAERGIPHALKAAERARAAYAHERAAGFLRMARDLAATSAPAERAEILRQLAIAEAEAVRLVEAKQTVEDALEAMSAADAEPRACAEFLTVVARALRDGGADATVWKPLVEHGLALEGDARDLHWARLTLLHSRFEPIESGPIGGSHWLGHDPEAVAIARAEGDEEDYARTLDPLDYRTREETEALLGLARAWTRPKAIMWALEAAGCDLLYRHGAFREARDVYEELLAVGDRYGSIPVQGQALGHLTTALASVGDLPGAQEAFRRAQEVAPRLGVDHRMREFGPISRAIVLAYFLDGDWAHLTTEATRYATSAAGRRSPVGIVAAAMAALCACRAGNTAEARDLLQHVTSVAARVPPTTYALGVCAGFAATAIWELQAVDYAATCRRLMLDLLRAGVGDPPAFGLFELLLARMSTLLRDFEEAQDYFERARRKLDASGYSHVRAIVDYDQARALVWSGVTHRSRIESLLDAALAGFHEHQMQDWARRAAAEKDALTTLARSDASPDRPYPAGLTGREAEVLRLVAAGLTNKEIAAKLVLSVPTVERHVANIYGKIGASRRYEAVTFAQSHGLSPDSDHQVPGGSPHTPS